MSKLVTLWLAVVVIIVKAADVVVGVVADGNTVLLIFRDFFCFSFSDSLLFLLLALLSLLLVLLFVAIAMIIVLFVILLSLIVRLPFDWLSPAASVSVTPILINNKRQARKDVFLEGGNLWMTASRTNTFASAEWLSKQLQFFIFQEKIISNRKGIFNSVILSLNRPKIKELATSQQHVVGGLRQIAKEYLQITGRKNNQ